MTADYQQFQSLLVDTVIFWESDNSSRASSKPQMFFRRKGKSKAKTEEKSADSIKDKSQESQQQPQKISHSQQQQQQPEENKAMSGKAQPPNGYQSTQTGQGFENTPRQESHKSVMAQYDLDDSYGLLVPGPRFQTSQNSFSNPSVSSTNISDNGSINTQDALQLISKGVKLDHTDIFVPRPTPTGNSPISCLTPAAQSLNSFNNLSFAGQDIFSGHMSTENFKSVNKSSKANGETTRNHHVNRSTPNLQSPIKQKQDNLKKDSRKNKSNNSFFKRLSKLSFSSSSIFEQMSPPPLPQSKSDDSIINSERKAKFNSNPELLNSMKVENITVLNLQNTKRETKRLSKRQQNKLKRQSLKQQQLELKEYYKTHQEIPSVPPAFLLTPNPVERKIPATVLTKAEKTYPQTVKRASMQTNSHIVTPNPTPKTELSKTSTAKRLAVNHELTGPMPTPEELTKKSTIISKKYIPGPSDKLGTSKIDDVLSIENPDSHNTCPPTPPPHASLPSYIRADSSAGQEFEDQIYQEQHFMNGEQNGEVNNDGVYYTNELYTLSEKSVENSINNTHSRNISNSSRNVAAGPNEGVFLTPMPIPQKQNVDKTQMATYIYSRTSSVDNLNNPVLMDYSSASMHSSDFFSASSGSEDELDVVSNSKPKFVVTKREQSKRTPVQQHDYDILDDIVEFDNDEEQEPRTMSTALGNALNYPSCILEINKTPELPGYPAPVLPVEASLSQQDYTSTPQQPNYSAPSVPLNMIPVPIPVKDRVPYDGGINLDDLKLIKDGHYYKNLVRMGSGKSFSSTKVRIDFSSESNGSDDF
ncbi:hypothetical protein DASC09_044230 [Saccharomycopsis crataegensis]|uniref:Uncharacterized protein n=1 Tax=Saccharomycopsis crataegensis TaxID=43959 RepID=A0AAV5QQA9_9ASCO|nr:hypothetical protein DASC09_044230 [Saccharomycopsis crataegensis]